MGLVSWGFLGEFCYQLVWAQEGGKICVRSRGTGIRKKGEKRKEVILPVDLL